MTTSEAGGNGPGWNGARLGVLLSPLVISVSVLGACGGDGGSGGAASGNAVTGRFHPPPIQVDVPKAARDACSVSSPTIDRIKKDGVLFWAIGVSPPFGFELEPGKWAGVEAQNAAELATILGRRGMARLRQRVGGGSPRIGSHDRAPGLLAGAVGGVT
jgi:hypothetical protein